MKKILGSVLIPLIVLVIALIAGRNFIVKAAVNKGIKAATGLDVQVERINIGLLSSTIEIVSLKVYNPSGFTDRLMADTPLIYVDYDLGGLLKSRVHLNKVKIDIKELLVVLNEQGKLNFNSLALLMPKPSGSKPPEVKIDELALKIEKVGYKSYLPAIGTKTGEFNPGIDETFTNVTNPSVVAGDILKKILSRVGMSNFAKFDIEGQIANIKQSANQALQSTVKESLDKTEQGLKNIFSQ
ncbi:MAG: hypothetical protein ACM3IL_04735 [Deltaproteobacteria bacterium]